MRRKIEIAFPHSIENGCICEENDIVIVIHDNNDENRSCICKSSEFLDYPKFTVNNPNGKRIFFLAIDNCVLFSNDGGKCDFAVFDDKKFVFVEIKKGGGTERNRSGKKMEAISQLRNTLDIFLNEIDFNSVRIYACVSVGYFDQSPAASASDLDLLVEFINDYNVELIEGNAVEFL